MCFTVASEHLRPESWVFRQSVCECIFLIIVFSSNILLLQETGKELKACYILITFTVHLFLWASFPVIFANMAKLEKIRDWVMFIITVTKGHKCYCCYDLNCEKGVKTSLHLVKLFLLQTFLRWAGSVWTLKGPWGLMMRSCHTVTMRPMTSWMPALKGKRRNHRELCTFLQKLDPAVSG